MSEKNPPHSAWSGGDISIDDISFTESPLQYFNMNSSYCDTSSISPSVIITNNTSNTVSNVPYSVSFEGNVLASGTIYQLLSMGSDTIGFGPVALSVDTAVFETWFNLTGAYFNDTIYFTSLVSNITASTCLLYTSPSPRD